MRIRSYWCWVPMIAGVGSASAAGVKTNAKVKDDAVNAAIVDDTFITMIVPVP
nr:hypothetical protein [Corynebacterium pseudotuberculosis]